MDGRENIQVSPQPKLFTGYKQVHWPWQPAETIWLHVEVVHREVVHRDGRLPRRIVSAIIVIRIFNGCEVQIIREFHGSEARIEKSVRGSLFGITRLCRVMPNGDPEGRIFLSGANNHDNFFFLHTFWSPAFDFNAGVAIFRPTGFIYRWRSIDNATLSLSDVTDKQTSWLVNVTFDWHQVMTMAVQR